MTHLVPGDFAPMFVARSTINPSFRLETAGGRRLVLCFLGSMQAEASRRALASLVRGQGWFAAHRTFVFPISADRADAEADHATLLAGAYTVFWDFDLAIARLYGMVREQEGIPNLTLLTGSVVLDENQRFLGYLRLDDPD